jgi:hypothetical protein
MGKISDVVEQLLLGARVRQNHALEHATIYLLEQSRQGRPSFRGRATVHGFYVYGEVAADDLRAHAELALSKLRGGEPGLAIHPRCGTNLAVAGLLTGVCSALASEIPPRRNRYPRAILASLGALFFAPSLGLYAQKRFTTLTPKPSLRVVDIVAGRTPFGNPYSFVRTTHES